MKKKFKTSNPLKILVIDDSEFSRKSMSQILEAAGHNIVGEAANAEECMEVLKGSKPNLIIIDVVMPEINGIDLAKHLNENYDNIWLVMVSSLGQEHIILESIAAGASDFIHKPFRPDDFLAIVEKIAQRVSEEKRI